MVLLDFVLLLGGLGKLDRLDRLGGCAAEEPKRVVVIEGCLHTVCHDTWVCHEGTRCTVQTARRRRRGLGPEERHAAPTETSSPETPASAPNRGMADH